MSWVLISCIGVAAAAEMMNPANLETQQLLAMQAAAVAGMPMIDPTTGLPTAAGYGALGASTVPTGFSPGLLPGNMGKPILIFLIPLTGVLLFECRCELSFRSVKLIVRIYFHFFNGKHLPLTMITHLIPIGP